MEFVGTFWALVPPLVAIVLALITKETYSSLFVGIVVGALLLASFNPVDTLNYIICGTFGAEDDTTIELAEGAVVTYTDEAGGVVDLGELAEGSTITPTFDSGSDVGFIHAISDPWNAGIFVFLVMLGIMVALVNAAGGSAAFGRWAAQHIKSRVGAQIATFFLGVLIFIDDYFNCLTVGAVMRPVTDAERISRAKLSYIIDATAAPICMIAPISSWAAAVSSTADSIEGVSGIQLFVQAIPYNFYSLLTIVFVVAICIMGFDYGPMAKSEMEAYRNGNLGSLGNEEVVVKDKASLIDLLLPIVVLIVCCVVGMLYVGGFWDPSLEGEGYMDLAVAFGNTDASLGLPWGSLIALIITFLYLLIRRVVSFKEATECFVNGFKAMVPAMLILTFALTLKLATSALGADVFVHDALEGSAAALYSVLPAVIFLVALGLAFATGTSWGTFGILIPIVLVVFDPSTQPELMTIGLSACLAGAVCGDHISPISDTTVMASAGANVNHIEHVSTQIPYALTVAGISFVCFIIAGFVQNAIICLIVGIALTIGTLFVLRNTVGKKSVEDRKAFEAAAK